jgi:vitamin B12/bleomycin/antimicrobial peptide transport system ATP-binding/permease protein
MNSELLKSSVDWNNEFLNSAFWLLKAFAVAAISVLIALGLVGRFTEWGRQFWRITGQYFVGRASLPVWLTAAALLMSVVMSVRVTVLLSYYANDLFSALQFAFQGGGSSNEALKDAGIDGFWRSMAIFAVLATLSAFRFLIDLYVTQRFVLRWRVWLTDRLITDWLDGYAYFRGQLATRPIDNPEQRIQQDVDIVTAITGAPNSPAHGSERMLVFGAVESCLSVASFGTILWQLSGPLTVLGVTIPKALFWIVIVYVAAATVVAFWIGHPLIRLNFVNELRNASFRYAMTRLKDSAGAIGLYRGEDVERNQLQDKLSAIVTNYRGWLHRMMWFVGWNFSVSQAINPLPFIVQAQRLFAHEISFGAVMQSATAFQAIHDSLSFFRYAYDSFAGYRAALVRLDGLLDANSRARVLPQLTTHRSPDAALRLEDVDVRTPDGQLLIQRLNVSLEPGDSLVIRGPSGSGKTVLLESIAGLWPYASGNVHFPIPARATMFLSQLPYLPLGDLRAVASYPSAEGSVSDEDVQHALLKAALPHLIIRIREVRDWGKILSIGEQQRIAFARVLVNKPKAVFLDESTSALDEGLELMLYDAVRAALPDAIMVSVSHRNTVEQHHEVQLELLGGGDWRLDRFAATT